VFSVFSYWRYFLQHITLQIYEYITFLYKHTDLSCVPFCYFYILCSKLFRRCSKPPITLEGRSTRETHNILRYKVQLGSKQMTAETFPLYEYLFVRDLAPPRFKFYCNLSFFLDLRF